MFTDRFKQRNERNTRPKRGENMHRKSRGPLQRRSFGGRCLGLLIHFRMNAPICDTAIRNRRDLHIRGYGLENAMGNVNCSI